MPTVIGFDTATDDTVVGATHGEEVVFERLVERGADGRPAHATQLLPLVEEAAAAAGGWESVGRIAVGVGPGSFTGLRIGIATARSLAQALDLEMVGVGTLWALARGAGPLADSRPLAAVLDARRGEVFAVLLDRSGEQLREPFVSHPDELAGLLSQLPETPLAVGSGALRFRAQLEKGGAEVPGDAEPAHRIAGPQVCALGAAAPASSRQDVTPIYLRPPDAERWRERNRTNN
jgi:tRNA threonylcarbamoyladenosine biosynthesis protein TsaB